MTNSNPQEKIYITYKTRMTTEARLRKTAQISHILLSWYAVCLIILSMIDISGKFQIANSNMISAAVSVATFGLSLFIYGERYNERADQFKNCYLKLKQLYESSIKIEQKMKKYSQILEQYENQSDKDYDEMVFDAWLRGQALENACGPIENSMLIFCRILAWRLFRYAVIGALFVAPLVAGILWVGPVAS